jgi:hypothetical protein
MRTFLAAAFILALIVNAPDAGAQSKKTTKTSKRTITKTGTPDMRLKKNKDDSKVRPLGQSGKKGG